MRRLAGIAGIIDAMPWRLYGRMDDVELKAVWAYLAALPTPKGQR